MSGSNPKPAWKVTLNGVDLTARIKPRLISLSITACRQDAADQLDITLDDSDGMLAMPGKGALLRVWIGWEDTGLVDKGSFTIDERNHSGTPDTLTLRGRSADLRSATRQQREQSYDNTTVGAIVNELAGRNGLTPRCHASLASLAMDHIDQTNESDINFLTRMGKRYDAVATIKSGALIFCPIGQGTTASGAALPSVTLVRADGDQHHYHDADRDAYSGVRAMYDDTHSAHTGSVLVGSDDGHGVKTLRTTYATKSNALRGARSVYQRLKRGAASFDYTLARGRADLYPEIHVTLRGWNKPEIDATDWTIVRVVDTLAGQGYVTQVELEFKTADNEPDSDDDSD